MPSLYRMLCALSSVGVFGEEPQGSFALTEMGQCLRADASEPIGGWAAFVGPGYRWQAWASLLHTIWTGETAYVHVHGRKAETSEPTTRSRPRFSIGR